jgi:hypothetical protein
VRSRIAWWATAGFLVASGWAVFFLMISKNPQPIGPIMSSPVRLSCPIAIIGSHYPISVYSALAANVAIYALVGLLVETLRRRLSQSK